MVPVELESKIKTSNKVAIPHQFILGVRFDLLSLTEALQTMRRFVAERTPRQITFSNAYTLTLCKKDKDIERLINQSDLNLADGMSIVWGARWLGLKIPGRVAGPDLMEALCGLAAQEGYSVFLMGSSIDNLENLKEKLVVQSPGLNIVGMYSPTYCERLSDAETEKIIAAVEGANPDILFVGISCPKQEKWISENLARLNVPLCLGVGAAFDFLSGRIPRAPQGFRKLGLEWVYRLYCEPTRLWKRYLLGNFIFLLFLIKQMLSHRFKAQ